MSFNQPLPYRIAFDERDDYLSARVFGQTDTVTTSLAYWREIVDECKSRGATRVLVVENFENAVPLTDVFEVAEKLPEITRGIRVAFVDKRIEDFEDNKFAEDVAVNRGASGKVFPNEADAISWLRE